jgi:CBS domain containing-hemolysin-like protein
MSDVLAVPETSAAWALLPRRRHGRAPMAIIIDEDGGISGLVTLGDLVESLVGDISGDAGALIPNGLRTADGSFSLDGLTTLQEVRKFYDLLIEEDVEGETVGGYVFARLVRPAVVRYEIESADDHIFRAEEINGLRVARIRVLPSTHGSVLEEALSRSAA